jgi:ribosome-binding protein aMBF1 (putative translation factor)
MLSRLENQLKSIFTSEYGLVLDKLVSARKSAGLTQNELAQSLRKPQSFVSKVERHERRLDVVEFVVMCRALSISPQDILAELQARLQDAPKGRRTR